MANELWYIKQCDLFQQLLPTQLEQLESQCQTRQFARGDPVYLPEEQARHVLLLAQGRVKICSSRNEGKQAILAFIDPGELFGELAIVGPNKRENYAEAVEESAVVLIPEELMRQLIEQNSRISLSVTKLFGLRLRKIERRLKYLLFRSNRERLVHLLLELAEQYGQQGSEGIDLQIKLSHHDLACVIGSTRETVTVLLGELQNEGCIQLGRRRITITDLTRLAASIEPNHSSKDHEP
jgi:CRP-like cAMP-binding protein